jgi:hypothetical protein
MSTDLTILKDYFNWVSTLLIADDPRNPKTIPTKCNLVGLTSTAPSNIRTIEICTVNEEWDPTDNTYYTSLLGGTSSLLFSITQEGAKDIDANLSMTPLTTVPWYVDIKKDIIRGLHVTTVTPKDGTPHSPLEFDIYMVKEEKGDNNGPVFVSTESPPKWYTIGVNLDNVEAAWAAVFPVPHVNTAPFLYFMENSAKYITKCCKTNFKTSLEKNGLQQVCNYLKFVFDPYARLPSPQCDSVMAEMCATDDYKDDIECTCINRTNPKIMDKPLYDYLTEHLKIPAACISGACDNATSYVPAALRRQICPNICTSLLNVNADGYANVDIDGVSMIVECNQITGQISQPETSSSYRNDGTVPPQSSRWILYLQLAIITVMIILLIFL